METNIIRNKTTDEFVPEGINKKQNIEMSTAVKCSKLKRFETES
jgi:hypothetical protein